MQSPQAKRAMDGGIPGQARDDGLRRVLEDTNSCKVSERIREWRFQ